MVIRERCRSGCTGGGRTNHPLDEWGTKFAVTCHRACYPRCLHVVSYCRHAAQLSLRRPYRRVFCRVVSGAFAARTSVRAERATGCTFAAGRIAGDFGYRTATIKADDQRGRQFGGGQPDDHSDAELRVRQARRPSSPEPTSRAISIAPFPMRCRSFPVSTSCKLADPAVRRRCSSAGPTPTTSRS